MKQLQILVKIPTYNVVFLLLYNDFFFIWAFAIMKDSEPMS